MPDQPMIIQFIHSGSEYNVKGRKDETSIQVPWVGDKSLLEGGGSLPKRKAGKQTRRGCNVGCEGDEADKPLPPHTRRFVAHEGAFIDEKGARKTARLGFWTEWEACSVAERMPKPANVPEEELYLYPNWVHTLQSPLMGKAGRQNTDPCVFGSSFKYCNCLQHRKNERGRTMMRRLAPGSLILFGSPETKDKEFRLDTVFVVDGKGIDYGHGRADGVDVSDEFRRLTLEQVWFGDFTFYRGRTFDPVARKEPYSFTPARRFNTGSADCGRRFVLDFAPINCHLSTPFNPRKSQGFCPREASQETIRSVWEEVLRQVRAAGFVPAVHFDWPK